MSERQLVQKFWNYCNILRDDGLSYGELASQARHNIVSPNFGLRFATAAVEQLTYLLFLKMADEHSRRPLDQSVGYKEFAWRLRFQLLPDSCIMRSPPRNKRLKCNGIRRAFRQMPASR
jgi:type I restriction enzyme M protein